MRLYNFKGFQKAMMLSIIGLGQLITGQSLQASENIKDDLSSINDNKKNAISILPVIEVRAEIDVIAGGKVNRKSRIGMLGDKDVMETPFSTISYTNSYIENSQEKDIGSLIAKSDPTIYTSGSTGMINESYNIRGFPSSNQDISINGLYGVAPLYRTTLEFADRVEVLKGPSALLNGMPPGGSVGGSVNIVTKHALDTPTKHLTTTYENDTKLGVHADIGQRFGSDKQFGLRFNGVYRNGDTAVNNQEAKTQFASLGMDWKFDRGMVSADIYHSKDHIDGLNRGVSLAKGLAIPKPPKSDTVFAPKDTFTDTKDEAVILHGEFEINEGISTYASYGHSKTDFDSLASSTYEIINTAGDYRNNFSHQRNHYDKDSADIGLKFDFNTGKIKHDLVLNTTYYQHEYKFGFNRGMLAKDWLTNIYHPNWNGLILDKSFSSASLPKTQEVELRSYGVADNLDILDGRLNIIAGVRQQEVVQDAFDAKTGARTSRYNESATTPALAASYKIFDDWMMYGNYIEGLSIGSTAPSNAKNAGEAFPPYKTKQYELGTKFELQDFMQTIALFQIEKPSAITDPITTIYSVDGEQRNRGIEWGFAGQASQNLNLMGGISYTEAKLTKTAAAKNQGNYTVGTPKWQAKVVVDYEIPQVQGLSLDAHAVAMSKQYINAENTLAVPGRTIYDIGAQYKAQFGKFPTVYRAEIKNLTNKAYWASSLASGLGAPRTLMLSASFDF